MSVCYCRVFNRGVCVLTPRIAAPIGLDLAIVMGCSETEGNFKLLLR